MTGISDEEKADLLKRMCSFVPQARRQNIHLVAVAGDEITMCLPYRTSLVGNPETGALHSGALTILLDHTLGCAGLASDRASPHITPTLDLRIDHLRIAPAGMDLYACARAYRVTQRIAFVEGFAWAEEREKPIARATGSWVVMRNVDLRRVLTESPR